MTIRNVELPQCDVCGELWLPDKRLPSGEPNPARENPSLSKRCGKCKTPRWNENANPEAKRRQVGRRASGHKGKKPELAHAEPSPRHKRISNGEGLESLYGILAKEFKELGGGESYLKAERTWGPDAWERYQRENKEHEEHGR